MRTSPYAEGHRAPCPECTCRCPLRSCVAMTAEVGAPPFPFVIGAPRSGTALLRLILDSHPDLAIPPETGFLAAINLDRMADNPKGLFETILSYPFEAPGWQDYHLSVDEFRSQ